MPENTQHDKDRVVVASLRKDGTPDQTDDYEIIGDKAFALEAAKEQRRQMAVSAADTALRGVASADADQGNAPDTETQKLIDAHKAAEKAAEAEAEAEVEKRFVSREELTETAVAASAPENTARRPSR